MARRKFRLHDGKSGSAIAVRVTPRASNNKIASVSEDGSIKIHLTAAPVDGEANEKLIAFLSKILNVSKSSIEIWRFEQRDSVWA
jgi:uncharacterized protein (TIGR00251 family)